MAARNAEKQIPPEPHWAFCYTMLHKVSRSFALVIQQLGTELRNAVLFLGGGDAREALVYADRMVANQDVSLTVIRFLSRNFKGYNEIEKKLDDGIVTWFWVKNEINQRVVYREVV